MHRYQLPLGGWQLFCVFHSIQGPADGLTTLSSVWMVAEMACICVLLSLGSCELNATKFNLGVLCWTLSLTVSQSLVFAACRSGGASFLTASGTVSDCTLPRIGCQD